mmetsp:Transcript_30123/g.56348  ORF Transcript_30123/g.56348 Transcript_30123/m.56348 type:complete len:107 (-) Transcript_30123:1045-1365(-)
MQFAKSRTRLLRKKSLPGACIFKVLPNVFWRPLELRLLLQKLVPWELCRLLLLSPRPNQEVQLIVPEHIDIKIACHCNCQIPAESHQDRFHLMRRMVFRLFKELTE